MTEAFGIGDVVTFVEVHDGSVVRLIGTVVGLATAPGIILVKVTGRDEWLPGVTLVHEASGRTP